jgi:hypothetical protein
MIRLGQRDLFTKRVRKPPPAREIALQCMVADILTKWGMPGWRWTHLPFGEYRRPATAARLKRMGVQRGWADFILMSPAGVAHFLELKRKGETLSDVQIDFGEWCREHNVPFQWTDRFDAAVNILKGWGAVKTEVRPQ